MNVRQFVRVAGGALTFVIFILSLVAACHQPDSLAITTFGYSVSWLACLGLVSIARELTFSSNPRLSFTLEEWVDRLLIVSPGALVLWFAYLNGASTFPNEGLEL